MNLITINPDFVAWGKKGTDQPAHLHSLSEFNPYLANFVLKMLSAFYVCCIYSSALQIKFDHMFGLMLYISFNSYGHVGTVSSPNHTFILGKLDNGANLPVLCAHTFTCN